EVLAGLTESSKAENEDGFGYGDDALWVVDAATPLEAAAIGRRSPAAWLRERVCALLVEAPWQAAALDETLAWLIERLAAGREAGDLGMPGQAFPTAAIALVRQRHASLDERRSCLDVCLLGDIVVIVRDVDGNVVELVDPQFDEAEKAILAAVAGRLADGDDPVEVYRQTNDLLRERRRARNTADGLWVLSDAVAAADHAYLRSVEVAPGADLLVVTDGFARVVEPFGIVADAAGLLDAVADGQARDLLRALRAAEAADPERVRFPRFGVSDDATAVHARL
nr:protein phosphatase 2C domain-containing protein [Micromonospora sp. DSM 115978]